MWVQPRLPANWSIVSFFGWSVFEEKHRLKTRMVVLVEEGRWLSGSRVLSIWDLMLSQRGRRVLSAFTDLSDKTRPLDRNGLNHRVISCLKNPKHVNQCILLNHATYLVFIHFLFDVWHVSRLTRLHSDSRWIFSYPTSPNSIYSALMSEIANSVLSKQTMLSSIKAETVIRDRLHLYQDDSYTSGTVSFHSVTQGA